MSQAATSLAMSETKRSVQETSTAEIDKAIDELRSHATEFARLSPSDKAQLCEECIQTLVEVAPEWAKRGAEARGLTGHLIGEEWIGGPVPTARHLRLLVESLKAIAKNGKPPLGRGVKQRADGRLEVEVFPGNTIDKISFTGFTGTIILEKGMDEKKARAAQAAFYAKSNPEGTVSLVLGAGNVSSIGPMDALTKLFNDGSVCLIKMNPVNEWSGPIVERALSPLIRRGFLRVVYGGVEVGKYVCSHDGFDDIHITGSDRTHDFIVWGPPGPERDRRIKENDPILKKPIYSELGNISPVAIVPYTYTPTELQFQANNVASMMCNNASFNCNAAKMLITSSGWTQRQEFFNLLYKALKSAPTRKAYYPGAFQRYDMLTKDRDTVTFGARTETHLPWTLIRNVDSSNSADPLFTTEPFCSILSETTIDANSPEQFLEKTTHFVNHTLWGTLNGMMVVPSKLEKDTAFNQALDKAIVEWKYGTVGINHWPALSYALGTLAWGGYPGATYENIQSGIGWVHNTYMLEGIEKSVIRGPSVVKPRPLWFFNNHKVAKIAPKLLQMEAYPGFRKLPGLLAKVLF